MKKLAWKQILVTFAVSFVLGAVFGRWEFSHLMQEKWKDPEAKQRWILKRLDAGLRLNTGQERQVAEILKEAAPQMEAARAEMKPKLEILRKEVRAKIMPILSPDQQKKYHQMEAERQERKNKIRWH